MPNLNTCSILIRCLSLKQCNTKMNDQGRQTSHHNGEVSNRERRKLTRKFYSDIKRDEAGGSNSTDKDACDCLVEDCPGCHFPCPKCRSCKCGSECRLNRKWTYETIEKESDTFPSTAVFH